MPMDNEIQRSTTIQDHSAFIAGTHDFQADIEKLADSAFVGTILETVMLATEVRFAAVARVTTDRWVACRTVDEVNFGLAEGDEIEIQSTFCQSVRETSQQVVFSDVTTDKVYQNHPIAAKFGIVSYASIPIHRGDGTFFGTLCAIDTVPRDVQHPRAIAMLEMFAEIIGQGMEAEERLKAQERLIEYEREMARAQEEFVAILGHDLRNPVAALDAGVRQLEKEPQSDCAQKLLPLMRSSLHRMNELIDNILLHAKARLGGDIRISITPDAPLAEAIRQVVDEVRTAIPDQEITLDLRFDRPINCDAPRIAQAVSNLLSNATKHTTDGAPIVVQGSVQDDEVEITVANRGQAIPKDIQQNLFQPLQRGSHTTADGLGLGLHIVSSIATAHNGRVELVCAEGTTTFTFRLPLLAS